MTPVLYPMIVSLIALQLICGNAQLSI